MLAKAGMRVLGIERIDQQRITALEEFARMFVIENGRMQHFRRNPPLADGMKKGILRVDHGCTL